MTIHPYLRAVLLSASFIGLVGQGQAATANLTFTAVGDITSPTVTRTTLFRADLSTLSLSQIMSITVTDSNSGVGGSPGIYSGFDVDAIFLDADGDFTTAGDRTFFDTFSLTTGTTRATGNPSLLPSIANPGPTWGSSAANVIDPVRSTLNAIDGIFFAQGGLTLGDGGSLTASFSIPIALGGFLFIGEIGNDLGESIGAVATISDSDVPLPAAGWLLLGGLSGLGALKRYRCA